MRGGKKEEKRKTESVGELKERAGGEGRQRRRKKSGEAEKMRSENRMGGGGRVKTRTTRTT